MLDILPRRIDSSNRPTSGACCIGDAFGENDGLLDLAVGIGAKENECECWKEDSDRLGRVLSRPSDGVSIGAVDVSKVF